MLRVLPDPEPAGADCTQGITLACDSLVVADLGRPATAVILPTDIG
jgi:hypothetical protein